MIINEVISSPMNQKRSIIHKNEIYLESSIPLLKALSLLSFHSRKSKYPYLLVPTACQTFRADLKNETEQYTYYDRSYIFY